MQLDVGEKVLDKGTSKFETKKNMSVLSETVSALIKAVVTLQSIKESEINHVFKNLEVDFPEEGVDFYEVKKLYEINLIKRALRMADGSQIKAAKLLNIGPTTLNSIIKRRNIEY